MALDKAKIHYWWRMLQNIKLWQLFLVFFVMLFVSAYLLRQNNLGMVERRNIVKMTDEQGGDVQKALTELRDYVTHHMNTNMGERGIYLEKTYERAYETARQQAASNITDAGTKAIYDRAEAECRPILRSTGSFPAYTQCAADKIAAQGPGQDALANFKAPSADLYRHNFVSPVWSPDLAGFAVLFTLLVLLIIVGRLLLVWTLYLILKRRY